MRLGRPLCDYAADMPGWQNARAPLGILPVNVVSESSSIGALTALAVLFLHLLSSGTLLPAASVLFLNRCMHSRAACL